MIRGFGSRATATGLIFAACCVVGCEKSPPAATDPAMAPWRLDPKSQIELLSNGEFLIRGRAASNLGDMGAPAAEALPILDKLAKDDPHPKVRQQASDAATKIRAATGGGPSQ